MGGGGWAVPALRPMSFSLGSKGPSSSSFPDSTLNFPQIKCFSKGQAREEVKRNLEQGLRRTWRRTLGPLKECPKHDSSIDSAGLLFFQTLPFDFLQRHVSSNLT